jgi:hypothetical protein
MSNISTELSLADYLNGVGTKEERALWDEACNKTGWIMRDVQKYKLEAENLLAACEARKKLSEIRDYITKHPPTPGGIAFLIMEMNKFESASETNRF